MDNGIDLAIRLAEVTARNSISIISDKISTAKANKNKDGIIAVQSEIITSLINDKQDVTLIANEYKERLDGININDEDIVHLHNTIKTILPILLSFGNVDKSDQLNDNIGIILTLLNKDTLKTMQLLGFNYKKAIGEPLTDACSSAINSKLNPKSTTKKRK